jgi:sn-glycerol 3-phosphate transport system ATP-binding protein
MDEPLSNLDAKLRQEMRQEIRSLQQRLKMTMVYVTHDQVEAMTIADKIILMKDGIIEQHGTPEALYNRPETAFTGNFIGNPPMNILTPDTIVMDAFSSILPHGITPESHQIGIRPENIRISENRGIKSQIETIEYLGADTLMVCRFGKQSITLTVKGKTRLSVGDHITLDWKRIHIHLFDAHSGKRLGDMEKDELS